ncbi:MAG: CHAT domain-containing protein [Actinomycetia bacterium]|nr:CHAT domain-containing protein [Actinomycetes bacterium]
MTDGALDLVAEARRTSPAVLSASAAEALDRDGNPRHLVEAAVAALLAGEPGRARSHLIGLEGVSNPDLRRMTAACRLWAWDIDQNHYPGFLGGELVPEELVARPPDVVPADGPVPVRLIEAAVTWGPVPTPAKRDLVGPRASLGPEVVQQLAAVFAGDLQRFMEVAIEHGDNGAAGWSAAAQIDLLRRAGVELDHVGGLAGIRDAYLSVDDAVGIASTYLLEGDWHLTLAGSPVTLGFDLHSGVLGWPDPGPEATARASASYREAEVLVADLDQPGLRAELAMRRAAIAWFDGRLEDHGRLAAEAQRAWEAGGHAAEQWLTRVHVLLNRIASGEAAAVRLASGTGMSLEARGQIAELLAWARTDGSASYATGLGRLLQRAAEAWHREGDNDRAEVAASLALPLVARLGPEAVVPLLSFLAIVDLARFRVSRALIRLEQALRLWRLDSRIGGDGVTWLAQGDALMTASLALVRQASSGSAAKALPTLDRIIEAMQGLVEVADLPAGDVSDRLLVDASDLLSEVAASGQGRDLEQVIDDSTRERTGFEEQVLQLAAQALREQAGLLHIRAMLLRSQLARAGGWLVESDRWLEAALAEVDRGAPAQPALGVLILCVWGRFDEARRRLASSAVRQTMPGWMQARLTSMARDHEGAVALYRDLDRDHRRDGADSLGWTEWTNRAQAQLAAGSIEEARYSIGLAIEGFELLVADLELDGDRVGACDDPSAAATYLTASRIELARAWSLDRIDDRAGSRQAILDALTWSERGRSLAIGQLLERRPDTVDRPFRRWQEVAAVWATESDRLLRAYDTGDPDGIDRGHRALAKADDRLVRFEAELEEQHPELLRSVLGLDPPIPAAVVLEALPPDAAVVEYQLVGRTLVAYGAGRRQLVVGEASTLERSVESLVSALIEACQRGDPDLEAERLARLLLDPVAPVLRRHRRLVIVPFGPLHQVPFHVLPFDGVPLGQSHVVSYAPAASVLLARPLDRPIADRSAVVVGDPAFAPDQHPDLERLPGAVVEAQAVGRLLPSARVLLKGEATERLVRDEIASGTSSIVHLAAHGRLDEIAPAASSIVLAGRDELTVSDLIGLRLDVELVVLSACDTGRGAITLGGDVVGLARGLLAAGARAAVVSLWPVDDIAACVIMEAFYRQLAAGHAPAPALANAQREIRSLAADAIDEAYRRLGGDPSAARKRRGRSTAPAARGRRLTLPEEFVDRDDGDEIDGGSDRLSGHETGAWAPFVLICGQSPGRHPSPPT